MGRSSMAILAFISCPPLLEFNPTNTPQFRPLSPSIVYPASLNAKYAHSSNARCCGSMDFASANEIPKKPASNDSMSVTNDPYDARMLSSLLKPIPARNASLSHLSYGMPVDVFLPALMRSQKLSGPDTPPGNRQLIPITDHSLLVMIQFSSS